MVGEILICSFYFSNMNFIFYNLYILYFNNCDQKNVKIRWNALSDIIEEKFLAKCVSMNVCVKVCVCVYVSVRMYECVCVYIQIQLLFLSPILFEL
jgi:uncharacterized membrane protein YfhO